MIDNVEIAMPHALGPEKALISMMLQDNLANYPRFVDAGMMFEMFYSPSHIKIASVILEYCQAGERLEMITFIQKLINKSILGDVGGPAAITELFQYAPTASQMERFCEMVKAKYIERQLHIMSATIHAADIQNPSDIQELLTNTEKTLSELNGHLNQAVDTSVRSSVGATLKQFGKMIQAESRESLYGLITGFRRFDAMCMGLQDTEFYLIGARPSVGKTAFMMNIIQSVCVNRGAPSLVFSCEMSQDRLISRLIYAMARINYKMVATGQIPTKIELMRMRDAATKVDAAPLYISDKSALTIDDMLTTARRHKRDYNIKFIAIDYLQLMRSTSKKAQQSKNNEVSEISAACKQIAKELNLPVLALSQLSRDAMSGAKVMPPKMNTLRDSGSLEQDADVIGLLHRFDYEGGTERQGEAEIHIAKNRNGETGRIALNWMPQFTTYEERETP